MVLLSEAINDTHSPFAQLPKRFLQNVEPSCTSRGISKTNDVVTAVMLDNAPWAPAQISGTLGNDLAHQNPVKR